MKRKLALCWQLPPNTGDAMGSISRKQKPKYHERGSNQLMKELDTMSDHRCNKSMSNLENLTLK